jgi:excisionase family DNA binding protein
METQQMTTNDAKKAARNLDKLAFNKHETAAMMGCSWRHVQNLTTRRLLASVRLGRLVRYRRSDIEKCLEKLTVKAR